MTRESDEFADWDAAYLLGALAPDERWAYEQHLADCATCARSLAELAGVPPLLALVPADQVLATAVFPTDAALTDAAPTGPDHVAADASPATRGWPRLRDAARAQRRRTRRYVTATVLLAAAAVVAVALVLPGLLAPAEQSAPSAAPPVTLTQVQPSPLSADVRLVSEPWGTRIESTCSYAAPDPTSAPGRNYGSGVQGYAMYVTDRTGASSLVASWVAGPGSTVEPVGTTQVASGDIASVDIRSVATGHVLLSSHLGP
ncbi:anti-sigma-L factor RslA [Leifsonia kafniensis]|uniref:Anti-sigma-L factor RslA n=1 Tax=Leifsonia kafniensis TaxID=475957 RepID=A0ABP7K8Q2_9MICO